MILTLADEREVIVEDPLVAAQIVRSELESFSGFHPLLISIDGAWDMNIKVGLAEDSGVIQVCASSGEPPY